MKPKVYVETSVISYLTSRPNRDLIIAGNQQVTQDWWHNQRFEYELYISQLVVQEASFGDPQAAAARLHTIRAIPLLQLTEEGKRLAEQLVNKGAIPRNVVEDALHIAIATCNGMEYLLTWNFKHIANAVMRGKIEALCREEGYEPPTICTPQELFGE